MAEFKPATLVGPDGTRVEARTKEVADRLFASNYKLEQAPPRLNRTQDGGYETPSALDSYKNKTDFLRLVKEAIQRKQGYNKDIARQKQYWRTKQRDITPQADRDFSLMSPSEQASVRAAQRNAAGAHLQGLNEEEQYRGTRMTDAIGTATDYYNAKTAGKKQKAEDYSQSLSDRLKQLEIQEKLKEIDSEFGANGSINRKFSNATVDDIAEAIKAVESGGNYEAKGGSGENGAYQFMPSTWAGWSRDYANQVLKESTAQLPMTKENQDAVAKWKIQQWLDAGLTPQQIAAKWNSGSEVGWENKRGTNAQGVKYDVPAYVEKVTNALGKIVPETTKNEHITWTKANVKALAQKLGEDSNDLWDNYTDSQLDQMAYEEDHNIVSKTFSKIPPQALLRAGIDQDLAKDILTLKYEQGLSDEEIKTSMSNLGLDVTLYEKLQKILKAIDYTK